MNQQAKITEITNFIHIIRGQKVMLDRDLADLYGVEVRAINQAVKRNQARFPEDFCFKINKNDLSSESQTVILNPKKSKNYTMPTVFTEQGAYALSFVLKSIEAIEMGVFIARAFTHLRRFILKNENLMMELKNNDHLSTTFSNFEKRIEQNLIVLYSNNTKYDKEITSIKKRLKELENSKE